MSSAAKPSQAPDWQGTVHYDAFVTLASREMRDRAELHAQICREAVDLLDGFGRFINAPAGSWRHGVDEHCDVDENGWIGGLASLNLGHRWVQLAIRLHLVDSWRASVVVGAEDRARIFSIGDPSDLYRAIAAAVANSLVDWRKQYAAGAQGEGRLHADAAAVIRAEIHAAQGSEILFAGTVDAAGGIAAVRVLARGDDSQVLSLVEAARPGEVLIHNHPQGYLRPSDADLEVARTAYRAGLGFAIVNNRATDIYFVTEAPSPPAGCYGDASSASTADKDESPTS